LKRIESIKNPQVKQWKKLHTKKDRDKTGTFLIEGFHLVEEALTHKELILELIVSESIDLPSTWNIDNVNLTIVTEEIIKAISQTETSQGIVALCKQLNNEITSDFKEARLLLLDAVQDPGNLGTMIRTAEAAGIDAVIVGDGSVDIYNSKVIRSTQGAIFHLPIFQANLFDLIKKLKEEDLPIFGTSLHNAVNYKEVPPQDAFAIILGNEGNGVNQQLLEQTTQNLFIPIYGKSESLNVAVAAAILLYHLR
jgi:RNA methyltransferase, TrmH family